MLHNELKKNFWLLTVIFAAAFLLYANTIPNSYSLDDSYVTQNNPKVMKGLAGIPDIFTSRYVDEEGNSFGYRPVAMATFAIEQELWGQNPHMGHLINTLLYALCSMLLFVVLRKIFKNTHPLFTLVIVLFFAAHPIHTEAVASLKNRETLLSFFFSLSALSCFLKWQEQRRVWLVITGVVFFVLAFLSKQDAVTFTAVIPLALYYSSQESGLSPNSVNGGRFKLNIHKIYLALSICAFLIFYFATHGLGGVLSGLISYFSTLAFLILYDRKSKEGKGISARSILSWLFLISGILLFPSAIYFSKPDLALLSLVCFAVFFTRIPEKVKIRQTTMAATWFSPLIPLVLLGIAGILVYQLPNLFLPAENKVMYNFENPQFVKDPQYSTFPLALYTLFFYLQKLVWPHPLGFYYGYKMIPEVGWTTPEVIFSMLFHLGILAFALWKLPKKNILSFAILYYLVTISIFANIVIKIPGIVGERLAFFPSLGFMIALTYGIFRLLRIDIHIGKISTGKAWLLTGAVLVFLIPYSMKTITRNRDWKDYLTLFSHDFPYLDHSAKANYIYASQLLKEAFNNEVKNPAPGIQHEYLNLAVKHLKRAVEIDSTYKFAWNNLGYITFQYIGNREEGMRYLEKAVGIDPGYKDARFNLGFVYKQLQKYDLSIQQYREAVKLSPGNIIYLMEEADAWYRFGKPDTALSLYKKASRLDLTSDLPYVNMGNICWLSGDTVRAVENWEKAFERNPANLEVCLNLYLFFNNHRNPKALFFREKAKEIRKRTSPPVIK